MGAYETTRTFTTGATHLKEIADDVARYFQAKEFEVEKRESAAGWQISLVKDKWLIVCGMSSALSVELEAAGEGIIAKAKVGIVGQQAIPTLAGILTGVLAPAVIVAQIWGAVRSARLDDEALLVVERSVMSHSAKKSKAKTKRKKKGTAARPMRNIKTTSPQA